MLTAVSLYGCWLQYTLTDDKEYKIAPACNDYNKIAMAAVQNNPLALQYVSPACSDYNEIAMAAVQNNGLALQYVSSDVGWGYNEIAMAAVQNNGLALQYVSRYQLYNDAERLAQLFMAAVKQNPRAFKYVLTERISQGFLLRSM